MEVAIPAPENQWYARGLVFDRDLNQTTAIKRIESTARTFKTKKQEEQHGLELCKGWIDKRLDAPIPRRSPGAMNTWLVYTCESKMFDKSL